MFEWALDIVERMGYWGLGFLMFLENLFPPIPSEVIMPLGGFLAAQGKMNPVLVVLTGTAGSVLGALPWYYLGRVFGRKRLMWLCERYGFIMTMEPEEMERAFAWFHRNGYATVLYGRVLPAVRTLISVPAGLASMSLPLFLALTALGSMVWAALLTGAGYILESHYDRVEHYIDPLSKIIVFGAVGFYLVRLGYRAMRRLVQKKG
jgi:membrane protein DedA with SNARE-associated domain